ncbi:Na+/dicarboxylate, Na+/tricarboxylate and phosphate transporter [Protomyces lactucae-debilis]|uniref:Na+/dicarboxylate, Na+/tricarboxylate and phosphate transporter n=1 Tax=Protomyces lactucae-debilis TaxID=2754530 RepID=A0A1Y2F214_PROLT|nr:Na+/dicarboxylate, Na+/tricarboxylate and phosphate transporter [Protomyces lactucae-debilis]ORY77737.1 Na+/dicarboxylate, Na+/tricarboxylate and phosphate transporter [Protomyces lactucae-debilis]
MKFSHSLQFNAVPEWADNYIAYSNLKKLIYVLEKAHLSGDVQPDEEAETLLSASDEELDQRFMSALDKELVKIDRFYQLKEQEVFDKFKEIDAELSTFEAENDYGDFASPYDTANRKQRPSVARSHRRRTMSGSQTKRRSSTEDNRLVNISTQSSDSNAPRESAIEDEYDEDEEDPFDAFAEYETQIALKKRVVSLYVELCELRSFSSLNSTGFAKALKKFDKTLNRDLRSGYLTKVADTYPFKEDTKNKLSSQIIAATKMYAKVTSNDFETAKKELKTYLREHVVWERNTVWREMINIERRAEAASVNQFRSLLGQDTGNAKSTNKLSVVLRNPTLWTLLVIFGVFIALLFLPTLEAVEQSNCLALLIFVSLLWATEVIPLFTTSLLVPLLVVLLRVVRSDDAKHHRLGAPAATKYIFSAMWTPTIMLLLGGFSIAAALSKYHIAKLLATKILSRVGTNPRMVLLAIMFVAAFASMWISNVAAPVLCFSIIQPILRTLPNGSEFAKCLIIGIALASNVGGMASPIASPQNIVALQNMSPPPSWGQWFFISIPVCTLSILLIWALLLFVFRSKKGAERTVIQPIRASKDEFTRLQYFISFITLLTIALWCVERSMEGFFGDMGVVALIPLVVFFGTGILTKEDFNNFLWTVIILAMGGIALGKAVSSSGLLQTIALAIRHGVEGMSLYGVFLVFAALILVVATFISHTVAALIVLPIVAQVGASMEQDPHPRLLVLGAAMMASAAMGLPTSGFPNMTAIMMENEVGVRYLSVKDFLKSGLPASLLAFGVVTTVGFGLTKVAGL